MGKASRKKSQTESPAEFWKAILRETTARAVDGALAKPRTTSQFSDLGAQIDERADQVAADVLANIDRLRHLGKQLPQVDCRKGCFACCHTMRVLATPLEIVRLTSYLRENWTEQELTDLRKSLSAYDAEMILPDDGSPSIQRIACPFLSGEGACSIYPARPIGCRVFHSLDVQKCLARYENPAFDNIPQYSDVLDAVAPIVTGIGSGLKRNHLRSSPLLFVKAMLLCLNKPDTCDRYLAGEDVFACATSPAIERSVERQSQAPKQYL